MKITAEELFVRRYDDLLLGLDALDDYDIVKLGAILRQLLLDQVPLVHSANRKHRIKLRFLVNKTIVGSDLPIKPDILFHAESINPALFTTATGTESLALNKFLNLNVIELESDKFSIKDIIKYAANKSGGVHYDENLDGREIVIRETFKKISVLGVPALATAIRSIAGVVLQSLVPLRRCIVKIPESIPLVAHYKLNKGGAIYFGGNQWMKTDDFSGTIENGFSWSGVLRIIIQPRAGNRVIYEAGRNSRSGPRFTIRIDRNGDLCCSARLNSSTILNVQAVGFAKSKLFDRYFYLLCELCVEENAADLSLYVNNNQIAQDKANFRILKRNLVRQVLGGSLKGRQEAAFYAREIVIASRCLSQRERKELARYLWLQWKD